MRAARRVEQRELRRVGACGWSLVCYVVTGFEERKYLPGPPDDRRRKSRKLPHMDAVRPVGAARLEAVQEYDLFPGLTQSHVEVARVGDRFRELRELVIMCREDRLAADRVVQELGHGRGDRDAVVGRCPPA